MRWSARRRPCQNSPSHGAAGPTIGLDMSPWISYICGRFPLPVSGTQGVSIVQWSGLRIFDPATGVRLPLETPRTSGPRRPGSRRRRADPRLRWRPGASSRCARALNGLVQADSSSVRRCALSRGLPFVQAPGTSTPGAPDTDLRKARPISPGWPFGLYASPPGGEPVGREAPRLRLTPPSRQSA